MTDSSAVSLREGVERVQIMEVKFGINEGPTLVSEDVTQISILQFGKARARNIGLDASCGEYIAFLDDIDDQAIEALKNKVAYMESHPRIGVLLSHLGGKNSEFLEDESFQINKITESTDSVLLYVHLLGGAFVSLTGAIMRRGVYEAIGGFNESIPCGEDFDFSLKLSRVAEIHYSASSDASFPEHLDAPLIFIERFRMRLQSIQAAYSRWGLSGPDGSCITQMEFSKVLGRIHFNIGLECFRNRNFLLARRSFANAFLIGYKPVRSVWYLVWSLFQTRETN